MDEMTAKELLAHWENYGARIMTVLKTVARGDLIERTYRLFSCPHCSFEESPPVDEPVQHDADCIVSVARAILRELGRPMRLYHLEWELSGPMDAAGYVRIGFMRFPPQREAYVPAQSPEEIDTDAVMLANLSMAPFDAQGEVKASRPTITLVCDL